MNNTTSSKKPFFYGYIIILTCLLIQAIPFGIAQNIQPQFIHYVTHGENFTLTQFNFLFTIGVVVSGIASPFIGALFDNRKINKKILYLIGAILSGGGFALFGLCNSLWQFYAVSAIVQVGTSIISGMGVPTLINYWFKDKKAIPLSIAFAGGGIGNVFLQSISAYLIPKVGYSSAYIYFGLASVILTIPIVILLLRFPRQKDTEIFNTLYSNDNKDSKPQTAIWGYSINDLKNIKMFWLFALGWVLTGFYVASEANNYIAYLQQLDYMNIVGVLGSTFAVCTIIGNISGGKLFNKLGITKALLYAGFLVVSSAISLLLAPYSKVFCFTFALCFGLSVFSYVMGPSYIIGELFGNKHYGAVLGFSNVFFAIGVAVGPPLFATLYQNLGHTVAWSIVGIAALFAYISLIISSKYFINKASEMKSKVLSTTTH